MMGPSHDVGDAHAGDFTPNPPAPVAAAFSATVAGMKKRARRPGATETIGVSVNPETKRALRALAEERHAGNVSALISEMTAEAVRQAAFERAWQWYGGPEPTDSERRKLDRELDAGWAHARRHAARKKRPRSAA